MKTINKVTLVGNVSQPPIKDGTTAYLSLGTVRPFTKPRVMDWHRIRFHNRLADYVMENIRAGDGLFIEGRIEYSSYERGDGTTIPTMEIVATELVLLRPKALGRAVDALEALMLRCDGEEGVRPDGSNIDTADASVALREARGERITK